MALKEPVIPPQQFFPAPKNCSGFVLQVVGAGMPYEDILTASWQIRLHFWDLQGIQEQRKTLKELQVNEEQSLAHGI